MPPDFITTLAPVLLPLCTERTADAARPTAISTIKSITSALRINCFMKKLFLSILISLTIITQTACGALGSKAAEPVSREEYLLDTICSISVYKTEGTEAEAAIEKAFELCMALEDKLSRTRKDSDVGRINAANGDWVEVSDETIEIIKKGLEYSELSEGAFDITVGGITEQWDFHAAEGKEKLPDEKMLTEAAAHVDYKNVEIDGNMVRLKDPKAEIDLGGIAKGYIGDKMTECLEEAGVTSGIINLGGNVICMGGKTDKEDFVIGVEAPFSDRTEIIGKVKSRDKTLVTSGIYERKIEVDGKTYHHILNSKTGWPVETDLDAVTLVAEKGRSADIDALSTICLIKGAEEGLKIIENEEGIEGLFVLKDGSIKKSSGMEYEGN